MISSSLLLETEQRRLLSYRGMMIEQTYKVHTAGTKHVFAHLQTDVLTRRISLSYLCMRRHCSAKSATKPSRGSVSEASISLRSPVELAIT